MGQQKRISTINHYATHRMIVHLPMYFTTVVQLLNQGIIRHRAVIDGGVFFGYFLDKQKETRKKADK